MTHASHKSTYGRKMICWFYSISYGSRIIVILHTEQILIHNQSLHAENGGMCENEGLIERVRYSEVLLILITLWDCRQWCKMWLLHRFEANGFQTARKHSLNWITPSKKAELPIYWYQKQLIFFFPPLWWDKNFLLFSSGLKGRRRSSGTGRAGQKICRWLLSSKTWSRRENPWSRSWWWACPSLDLYSTHQYFITLHE